MQPALAGPEARRPYRFGFILTTLLGNETRYRNLKKYSVLDEEVECVWAPVQHYYRPGEHDPVRWLPGPLHTRAVTVAQAWPVLRRLNGFDAVMLHQFEVQSLVAARALIRRRPLLVAAQDMPPIIDRATYPLYPEQRVKAGWRARLRLANDVWAVRQAGYFIGFSDWSSEIMVQCGLDPNRVASIHVGLDLARWTPPPPKAEVGLTELLFVGGDFERKGGPVLLDIFARRFTGRAVLNIVTRSAIATDHPNIRVHTGLGVDDPRLIALFQRAHVLVLPTLADLSSWVSLEAMASGCAVAASRIGGIPDIVTPETGLLFDPEHPAEIAAAIDTLIADREVCRRMGQAGRARVEQAFDARRNVPAILDRMKSWVDEQRAARRAS